MAKKNLQSDNSFLEEVNDLSEALNLTSELYNLKLEILEWISKSDSEMQEMLKWQLISKPKFFRPLTVFACHQAFFGKPISSPTLKSALAVELIHNVSLIIDDILDRSRFRRGRLTLHCRYGSLPALMTAGYLYSGACKLVAEDSYLLSAYADLMQRLGIAECRQWRLRRTPLGLEDWRLIAKEDTGSMFETCARIATHDDSLSRYGNLLGILYHGCDDVADIRGTEKLGGGGEPDIRDGILTLPAAIAIKDPRIAALFRNNASYNNQEFYNSLLMALPAAEKYLDEIRIEAMDSIDSRTQFSHILHLLLDKTRLLSSH